MIIKEYETSSMSAAQVAPQAPVLIATIMCRVLRFLRNIALRYARARTPDRQQVAETVFCVT